jgi:hypothetical protein
VIKASERRLAEDLAQECSGFGLTYESEAIWGLTKTAANELRPVADALVAAMGTRQWWDEVQLSDQRFVAWDGRLPLNDAELESALETEMGELRAGDRSSQDRPGSEQSLSPRLGDIWWSTPWFAERAWSTNAIEGLWSLGLLNSSDAYGPADPDAVIAGGEASPRLLRLKMNPRSRVFEIASVNDWQSLVDQFPCDVSATHGKDWSMWTNKLGPWLLPDWQEARRHYDGVHVGIGGYLSSCGIAVPVRHGYSMLAGWMPGATLWLRDMVVERRREGSPMPP